MFKKLWVYHDYHIPTKFIIKIARRENISFVLTKIFGDTNSPSYAQIISDGCSYSQKL
jgi:hypothetical protein